MINIRKPLLRFPWQKTIVAYLGRSPGPLVQMCGGGRGGAQGPARLVGVAKLVSIVTRSQLWAAHQRTDGQKGYILKVKVCLFV